MCRKNQLWGCALIAFGAGVLVGLWLGGGFFAYCFGIGAVAVGVCVARSR